MNKFIFTLAILLTASISFADGNDNDGEVRPTSVLLKDSKSFEVGGLKACDVEADDEDAIDEDFIIEDALMESTEVKNINQKTN